MRLLRGLKKTFLRILLVVAIIAVLNFIGLDLYGFLTRREMLSSLWIAFILEGFVMMLLGILGVDTEDVLLSRIGWLGYVVVGARTVHEEIMKDRPRKVNSWIQLIIIGVILMILGLLFNSLS